MARTKPQIAANGPGKRKRSTKTSRAAEADEEAAAESSKLFTSESEGIDKDSDDNGSKSSNSEDGNSKKSNGSKSGDPSVPPPAAAEKGSNDPPKNVSFAKKSGNPGSGDNQGSTSTKAAANTAVVASQ